MHDADSQPQNATDSTASSWRGWKAAIWCVLGAAAAVLVIAAVARSPYLYVSYVICEDAFYYSVPAWHYVQSGVLALDGRNPTNGFHPLWMLVNVGVAFVSPNKYVLVYATSLLGWACALGAFLVVSFGLRLSTASRMALFALLFVSPLALWWLNGMETGLALLALAAGHVCAVMLVRRPRGVLIWLAGGLVLGLMVVVRLDYAMFALGYGAAVVAMVARRRASDPETWRRFALVPRAVGAVLAGALPIGLYLVWNWTSFGELTPISSIAKRFYANQAGQTGFEHLWVNASAYFTNYAGLILRPWASDTRVFAIGGGVLLVLASWGLLRALGRAAYRADAAGGLALLLVALSVVHGLLYAHQLGHFARDAYIDWYYPPQILAGALLLAGAVQVARERAWGAIPAGVAAAMIVGVVGAAGVERLQELTQRRDLNVFVRVALFGNRFTPPGSRLAALSAGTQAFLAEDGRTVTNIDGLINTPRFWREYQSQGRLNDYLRAEEIDYFADYVSLYIPDPIWGDVQFPPSTAPRSAVEIMTQWPAWGTEHLHYLRIRETPVDLGANWASVLGPAITTSAVAPPGADGASGSNAALLGAEPAGRGETAAFELPVGHYRILPLIEVVERDAGLAGGSLALRVSCRAGSGATFGERGVLVSQLPPAGSATSITLFAAVAERASDATIVFEAVATGLRVRVPEVRLLPILPPPPLTVDEVGAWLAAPSFGPGLLPSDQAWGRD